ncbi:Rad9-domain-containing protein [Amylostereum chailletii]|nr:Rad9-domain-containing protein [Amylostereum chailletii]
MQATLDSASLRPFTRALTCLSKYGDDLTIHATSDSLSLSTTNSSMSAYCRFRYGKQFFARYNVGERIGRPMPFSDDLEEIQTVTGQLLTKSLLAILKHRATEKTVEKCELSIVEGATDDDDDEQDSLESKLVVRLHCKHGIVKTHRLLLLTPNSLMAPGIPDAPNESRIAIGPKAMKDMIGHFPSQRGSKSDPQLVWEFGDLDVQVRSFEAALDNRGAAQLSTELTISVDEFDHYDIYDTPVSIAFHLREFNATIAYAESMSLALDLRFTDPAAPLFIDVESDSIESLFVVSTSQVPGSSTSSQARSASSASNKRPRTQESQDRAQDRRRPMKVVERTDATELARRMGDARVGSQAMPPPSLPMHARPSQPPVSQRPRPNADDSEEPLFLPASQMSAADEVALRQSGLGGIDGMDADDFHAMFEDDGEEVGAGSDTNDSIYPPPQSSAARAGQDNHRQDNFDMIDDAEMGPTQTGSSQEESKVFTPLFDD